MSRGIVIAAPASSSGKTILTLALLRALQRRGRAVGSLKIGPDYIDPTYHHAASGRPCFNLDLWAMDEGSVWRQVAYAAKDVEFVIAEGVMGLFDGARVGSGSTADAAARLHWPVVLVVDAKGQGASAAALVKGFAEFRADVNLAGVILNRVGGAVHTEMIADAMKPLGIPVLGALPASDAFTLPSRHLGLVLAPERDELDKWIDRVAGLVEANVDIGAIEGLGATISLRSAAPSRPVFPAATVIAVARDAAFSFVYPHWLLQWQETGRRVHFFSPLAGEGPPADADAVVLPGGYPELHAAKLAASEGFFRNLRTFAEAGRSVYGECGGLMVLGRKLIDKDGVGHEMADLLPVVTSMAKSELTLGYRDMVAIAKSPFGGAGTRLRGHEFHYSTLEEVGAADPLFEVRDAAGNALGCQGFVRGAVSGSYIHVIEVT